jgi:tight adherence protein B
VLSILFSITILFQVNILFSLLICIVFFVAFINIFRLFSHRKNQKKERQLEHFLIDLIGNMYGNPNILNGIENTVKEIDQPLKNEFEKVIDDTRRGMLLRDSLLQVVKRNDSRLIELVITSLVIADDKGVDVIDFLKDQLEYIRQRRSLENYIKILSSGPRYTSYIIVAIPMAAIVVILLINKNFLDLYVSGIGMVLIGYSLLSYLVGFLIINRMTDFLNKNRLIK